MKAWGDEGDSYSCSNPGFSSDTGHFTQLVWKSTTTVGCARVNCDGTNDTPGWSVDVRLVLKWITNFPLLLVDRYVTCEYDPAGNIVSDDNQYFIDNVEC